MNATHFLRVVLFAGACSITLSACVNLAPDYERPTAPVATAWSAKPSDVLGTVPVDELGWSEFYSDERLRQLITLALENNRSLRQTALAVESARAQFKITRSSSFPSLDAGGSDTALRKNSQTTHAYSASLGISAFELDFFGRINNLRGQALETFLSYEESLGAMRITPI